MFEVGISVRDTWQQYIKHSTSICEKMLFPLISSSCHACRAADLQSFWRQPVTTAYCSYKLALLTDSARRTDHQGAFKVYFGLPGRGDFRSASGMGTKLHQLSTGLAASILQPAVFPLTMTQSDLPNFMNCWSQMNIIICHYKGKQVTNGAGISACNSVSFP